LKLQDAERVFNEIKVHIEHNGKVYSDWYCAVASNWEESVFSYHRVPRTGHPWIARQCFSSDDAEIVESRLAELGCEEGLRVADLTMTRVYAYLKKKTITNP
jgi:hypothetical protein